MSVERALFLPVFLVNDTSPSFIATPLESITCTYKNGYSNRSGLEEHVNNTYSNPYVHVAAVFPGRMDVRHVVQQPPPISSINRSGYSNIRLSPIQGQTQSNSGSGFNRQSPAAIRRLPRWLPWRIGQTQSHSESPWNIDNVETKETDEGDGDEGDGDEGDAGDAGEGRRQGDDALWRDNVVHHQVAATGGDQ
jgi:hypothetical protein